MKLTHQQMLSHWRCAQGVEEDRRDCSIYLYEGVDTTFRDTTAMRMWYLNLLDTAPLRYLVTRDVAESVRVSAVTPGVWELILPASVRRTVSVTLTGSGSPAPVLEPPVSSNPFLRGSISFPLVIRNGRNLLVYTPEMPVLSAVMAVTDPGDEYYEMEESALSLLPGREYEE